MIFSLLIYFLSLGIYIQICTNTVNTPMNVDFIQYKTKSNIKGNNNYDDGNLTDDENDTNSNTTISTSIGTSTKEVKNTGQVHHQLYTTTSNPVGSLESTTCPSLATTSSDNTSSSDHNYLSASELTLVPQIRPLTTIIHPKLVES